ncbi:hypothetical protein [Planctomycetes bacterium TBK1r]|uniref:Uncharacterized protein n=1 Tax=Stieleria magnilauensis TaxID=2527963 RepID=A0ABX5XSK7_9BACT|nr:hypothetical protein TBK1r_39340 [Planctomycetes bacterium TBK1r]
MYQANTVFIVALGVSLMIPSACYPQQLGILGEAAKKPEDIAGTIIDEMHMEVQSATRFATCYAGSYMNDGRAKPNANGVFEFVGFYARGHNKSGERQVRVWSANDATVNGQFLPFFYTNDRLFTKNKWSYTKCGSPVKDVDPHEEKGEYRFRGLCLDSRLAMIQFAYGISSGKARGLCEEHYFLSSNLVSAERTQEGNIIAVVQGPGKNRFHCTLDKRYEFRPSKIAVTKEDADLLDGDTNAIVINEIRWTQEKDAEKGKLTRWIADAGKNTQYGGGTKASAPRAISYSWKAAWWYGDDVPAHVFSKEHVTSDSGKLFDEFGKFIEKASSVRSFDEAGG